MTTTLHHITAANLTCPDALRMLSTLFLEHPDIRDATKALNDHEAKCTKCREARVP